MRHRKQPGISTALLDLEAKAAGLELKSENKMMDDGLGGKVRAPWDCPSRTCHNKCRYTMNPDFSATLSYNAIAAEFVSCVIQ